MKLLTIFLFWFIPITSQPVNEFYPDGYYFTKTIIKTGDWNFAWLSIMIKPVKDSKKSVSVRFQNSKIGKWIDVEAKDYYISHDSTRITFQDDTIGEISFEGRFVHSKVPYDDKAVKAMETIVFIGTYTFENKTLPVNFVWSEGD